MRRTDLHIVTPFSVTILVLSVPAISRTQVLTTQPPSQIQQSQIPASILTRIAERPLEVVDALSTSRQARKTCADVMPTSR